MLVVALLFASGLLLAILLAARSAGREWNAKLSESTRRAEMALDPRQPASARLSSLADAWWPGHPKTKRLAAAATRAALPAMRVCGVLMRSENHDPEALAALLEDTLKLTPAELETALLETLDHGPATLAAPAIGVLGILGTPKSFATLEARVRLGGWNSCAGQAREAMRAIGERFDRTEGSLSLTEPEETAGGLSEVDAAGALSVEPSTGG